MPTGYTADVADGKLTSFRLFALRCARAFGQREDSMDVLPKHRESSDWHEVELAKAKDELARLLVMSEAEKVVGCAATFQEALDFHESLERAHAEKAARYNAMLAEVETWTPPTDEHVPLKKFMLEQLRESINFDCYHHDPPKRQSAEDWHEERLAHARRDVDYHSRHAAEEKEKCARANAWIDALYASLGAEP